MGATSKVGAWVDMFVMFWALASTKKVLRKYRLFRSVSRTLPRAVQLLRSGKQAPAASLLSRVLSDGRFAS